MGCNLKRLWISALLILTNILYIHIQALNDPFVTEKINQAIAKVKEANDATSSLSKHFRRVLFTIKLLHKCFEFLCSLPFYWLGLCVLRRTCRQNRLYETLFHTVIILSKHHHHHHQ
jgi:hypothetical protein